MQLKDAIQLIDNNYLKNKSYQVWADLGCGSGTFTMALANLLPERSLIYAVDKSLSILHLTWDWNFSMGFLNTSINFFRNNVKILLKQLQLHRNCYSEFISPKESYRENLLNL